MTKTDRDRARETEDRIGALRAEILHADNVESNLLIGDESEVLRLLQRREAAKLELRAAQIAARARHNRALADRYRIGRHEDRLASLRRSIAAAERDLEREKRADARESDGLRVDAMRRELAEIVERGPDVA